MRYYELSEDEKIHFELLWYQPKKSKSQIVKEINEVFGISKRTVYRWKKEFIDNKLTQLDEQTIKDNHFIKARSTLVDEFGNTKLQWIKTDTKKENELTAITAAIENIITNIQPIPEIQRLSIENQSTYDDLITTYISNDIHFGALMWKEETLDKDWDLKIAEKTMKSAYNYLIDSAPRTRECIVLDLGDLTEVDDYKNATPKSGNPLTVDGRYPKVLKTAYMSLIYGIELALTKHDIVHFINVAGNHDISTGIAITHIIKAWFRNNPRVKVNEEPGNIKYFHYGKTLLQFAHGDGMKMADAGEVMVVDKRDIFSEVDYCYSLFGHYHKDIVIDGRITRAESFRNLAPLNDWASHKGYRRGLGTMVSIVYSKHAGEKSRNTFNVEMVE